MIYEEVVSNIRNLVTVWLDYRKAFDSLPHGWSLESFKLAQIPDLIIKAIKQLMLKWRTQTRLNGETESIEKDFINYLRGILQGDTLSLILLVLSVNPLSFLYEGYRAGKSDRKKT